MTETTVLIADDHGIVRSGLQALIDATAGLRVVGSVADGAHAVALAEERRPSVAVLDIEMPGLGGIEAAEQIRRVSPQTRVLILTMHDDPSLARAAAAAGAVGFLVKQAVGTDLITAIQTLAEGRSYFSVSIAPPQDGPPGRPLDGPLDLSPREQQVLGFLALGYTNKEIAAQLDISDRTVGTYRMRLAEKLGLRSRADIVRFALEVGILQGPGPHT